MKKLKVGVTGPISEVNFGDYAMFINNFYDISPNDVTIFSYNKGFSEKIVRDYCKEININTIEVKLVDKRDKNSSTSKPKVGFLPFNYPTETPLDILYRLDNYEELKEAILNIDVLIVNGGGYFNHLWNNSLWRSDMLKKIIAPILIASQMNKKIYFTGNGIGPFDQSEEFFNYVFNYMKNATYAVRDRLYSQKYLEKIGVSERNIRFIPDDLYFVNPTILSFPLSYAKELVEKGKYILMETYFSIEEIKQYESALKNFSKKIHEKYGLSIVFVPFDFERGGTWQGEYLSDKLDNFYMYDLKINGYLPIQDIHYLIQNAELVICNRYHALVLAISSGVPVINIIKKVLDDHRYYFNKNYGLLEYTFSGLQFNEMDFMKVDFEDALAFVEKDLESIISAQRRLFSSEEYLQNKLELFKKREDYLETIKEVDNLEA